MRAQFLFMGVRRRSCQLDILDRAGGTAEHYGSSLLAVQFAKAVLSNRVVTNMALLADRAGELRCTWFTVIG
jgi:hypothetical protein